MIAMIEECFTLGSHTSWITLFPLLRFVPVESLHGSYLKFSHNFKEMLKFAGKLVDMHDNTKKSDTEVILQVLIIVSNKL